ncbi:hypothetical protein RMN57_11830 [Kitasatospora sp. CM 4170]|uniref:Uncharacterized protein n=1 Tax=Kitasatospora aburaviensis TaxID=67265 RepID=A0ABW1EPU7_9ACTN|nr:hypothetical protein [Kitasatospora sp. CM 4170]WNM45355.1 hypothetical protein RMN57_11830 [Kitasatospora sp. CM 4170]
MGIGYLLLYAALAVVALWLVAELLLQNRAPLHWRGLALAGFLGVVGGMATGSVVVIGAGAALFAVGQTFVTLSVKRGYATGWSLRAPDGSLPGPLAKVPLLGALTGGGAAVAATAVAVERIGTVSEVESTPEPEPFDEDLPAVEQTAAFEMQELAADGVYASSYYEQQAQAETQLQAQVQPDPYADAYQSGYDPAAQQQVQQQVWDQQGQQQWQAQQQPAFAYDQGYGGYQQQPVQPDPYGNYQQVDPYGGYQQQPAQQYGYDQQQWQPQQPDLQHPHPDLQHPHPDLQHPQQGIPHQPQYDYGYQQPNTWQQQG